MMKGHSSYNNLKFETCVQGICCLRIAVNEINTTFLKTKARQESHLPFMGGRGSTGKSISEVRSKSRDGSLLSKALLPWVKRC